MVQRLAPLGRVSRTAVGSTGSPLGVEGYRWVSGHLTPDVPLACISGGTDGCAAFDSAVVRIVNRVAAMGPRHPRALPLRRNGRK